MKMEKLVLTASCVFWLAPVVVLGAIQKPDGGPYAETIEDVTWQFNVQNGAAVISGASFSENDAAAIIPSELGGCPVTQIGGSAFWANSIGSVEIPEGVMSIGANAFIYCSSLKRVTFPSSLTNIMKSAFGGCTKLLSIRIPTGVKIIGAGAFSGCYSIRKVTFEGDAPQGWLSAIPCAGTKIYYNVQYKSDWIPALSNEEIDDAIPFGPGGAIVEPTIVTNYIFSVVTNHVYHHDVVTDMTAYHTTVTNVHVHYLKDNTKAEFILPSSYDTGFVNVVAEVRGGFAVIPATWSVNYAGFTDRYGSDFSVALSKPNGKYDASGNPMYVWQDYVAGTNPMDETDVFNATIAIVDGKVKISHTPELDAEREALRKYTVYGKKNLMDSKWEEVADGDELEYNFYKVTVEMK